MVHKHGSHIAVRPSHLLNSRERSDHFGGRASTWSRPTSHLSHRIGRSPRHQLPQPRWQSLRPLQLQLRLNTVDLLEAWRAVCPETLRISARRKCYRPVTYARENRSHRKASSRLMG